MYEILLPVVYYRQILFEVKGGIERAEHGKRSLYLYVYEYMSNETIWKTFIHHPDHY